MILLLLLPLIIVIIVGGVVADHIPASRYYPLEMSYFKSSMDQQLLDALWNKYWANTLSSSALLNVCVYCCSSFTDIPPPPSPFVPPFPRSRPAPRSEPRPHHSPDHRSDQQDGAVQAAPAPIIAATHKGLWQWWWWWWWWWQYDDRCKQNQVGPASSVLR